MTPSIRRPRSSSAPARKWLSSSWKVIGLGLGFGFGFGFEFGFVRVQVRARFGFG